MFRRWFRRKRCVQLQLTIGPVLTRHRRKKHSIMATLQLLDNQQCSLAIQAEDAAGNPAQLPAGAVSWSSSNSTVCAVVPSADMLSAEIVAQGPLGTAQIAVAVSMPDGTALNGSLDVTVVAGAASQIAIVPATPTTKA